MNKLDEDCRIYVCRSIFGMYDDCLSFKNVSEYDEWLNTSGRLQNYTFQPVCNKIAMFDRCVLMMRSAHVHPYLTMHYYKRS